MKPELSEVNLYQCIILEAPDVLEIHFRRNRWHAQARLVQQGCLGLFLHDLLPLRSWSSVFFLLRVPRRTPMAFRSSSSVEFSPGGQFGIWRSNGKAV